MAKNWIRPVTYGGVSLRSTLEGRYLVFLDELKIPWVYEPYGHAREESSGFERDLKHVPDLWLPSLDMWAEIKPKQLSSKSKRKAEMVMKATGKEYLFLEGLPANRIYRKLTIANHIAPFDLINLDNFQTACFCWMTGDQCERCFNKMLESAVQTALNYRF